MPLVKTAVKQKKNYTYYKRDSSPASETDFETTRFYVIWDVLSQLL